MKRSEKGFTLVELMVTLAVLAILVTIGYPLYNTQLEKGRRIDAQGALRKLGLAQERHFTLFGSYATSVAQLNFGPDGLEDGVNDTYAYSKAVTDLDYDGDGNPDNYTIAIATDGVASTQDYVVTAIAKGSQAGDTNCYTYSINELGVKGAKNYDGDDQTNLCW
jgi:type IV pilus assembly protein PilE